MKHDAIWIRILGACVLLGLARAVAFAAEDGVPDAREGDYVLEAADGGEADGGIDAEDGPDAVAATDDDDDDEGEELEVSVAPVVTAPEAFPNVPLVANSEPRFAAVFADPWRNSVLYVMFDGNAEAGYNRLYAWIPDHSRFGEPQALRAGPEGRFPEIRLDAAHDDEIATLTYSFRFTREEHRSGGPGRPARPASTETREVFDYRTGQTRTVTRRIPARPAVPDRPLVITYTPHFHYSADYERDKLPFGGANRLEVNSIGNRIGPAANFQAIGNPHAPWNRIGFSFPANPSRGGVKAADFRRVQEGNVENAVIRADGRITRGRVVRMPRGFIEVTLNVSGYLDPPSHLETHDALDLISEEGVLINLPFGWYGMSWEGRTHAWLGGRRFSGRTEHDDLLALGRPRPDRTIGREAGGLGSGESAASRLRGPPPSQLRGPGNR